MVRPDSVSESDTDRPNSSYNSDEVYDEETASIGSSTSAEEDYNNSVELAEPSNKNQTTFGKIIATNCNDIHFGNKTFYHGPVTIKQFLYTNNPRLANSESVISDNDSVYKIYVPSDNENVPGNINKGDPKCISDNLGVQPNADVASNENKINNNNNVQVQHTENRKDTRWLCEFPKQHVILLVSLFIVLMASLIIATSILLSRHLAVENSIVRYPSDGSEQEEGIPGKSEDNGTFTLPGKLKIIARTEWLAQPPIEPPDPLKLPVPYVIIMHTATETCADEPTCIFHVRHIQMYHIESRKWWDIGYNFLVGGDGFAYEGRGWKSVGAHTYGYNSRSIGIALIGTFTNLLPLQRQITATKQLIEKGVELGYIAKNYKLLGARQLQSTESPGKLFFEDLKSWEHWAEAP